MDSFMQINDGAWCWLQDPRAIRHVGACDKIYWGCVTKNGDIKISSYDCNNHKRDTFTLRPALDINDHAAPAILIRNDGRIVVFYSKHNANTMYWRISTHPEDITAFGDEMSFDGGGLQVCYPNPVQLTGEDNKIYLFYRKRAGESPTLERESYRASADGENFGTEQDMVDVGNRTYVKVISNGIDKIHFCVTKSDDAAGIHKHVYYGYYSHGNYYKADGTKIGAALPLRENDLEKVYDSDAAGNYLAWIWDIALDADGNPCIAFATFVSDTDHRYNYARWTGNMWEVHEITSAGGCLYATEPHYSGGISLDKEDPSIAYLSKLVSSQWEIQKFKTIDGGKSWETPVSMTFDSPKKNMRPVAVRNGSSRFPVFWMYGDYTTYTDYETTISTKDASVFVGIRDRGKRDNSYQQKIEQESLFHDKSAEDQLTRGMIPDIRRAVKASKVVNFWDDPEIERIVRGDVRAFIIQKASEYRGRVLELGCGIGRLSLELARNGMDVVGIDISRKQIEIAKNYFDCVKEKEVIGNIDYVVADLNRIVFEECQYDAVIVWDVLHHIPEIEHLIREVRKSLKPGGNFLVLDYIGPTTMGNLCNDVLYFLLPTEASYSQKVASIKQRIKAKTLLKQNHANGGPPFEEITGIEMTEIIKKHFTIKKTRTLSAFSLPLMQYITARDFLKYRLISLIKLLDDILIKVGILRGKYVFIWAEKEG
jgi:2-polyprenyl-3-methyl-5-hydroxy-6-metoxy-1,4-benzoquinol methylase